MKAIYIILGFALYSCSSNKIDHTIKASQFLEHQKPYAQEWIGGVPGSGAGINLFFPKKIVGNQSIEEVYFKGLITSNISLTTDITPTVLARFSKGSNEKPDLIMDHNPDNELVNNIPESRMPTTRFKLQDDEAIIMVKGDNHKEKLIKITGIQLRSRLDMPAIPK